MTIERTARTRGSNPQTEIIEPPYYEPIADSHSRLVREIFVTSNDEVKVREHAITIGTETTLRGEAINEANIVFNQGSDRTQKEIQYSWTPTTPDSEVTPSCLSEPFLK